MSTKPRLLKWRTIATLLPLLGMLALFKTAYTYTPVRDRDILVGGMFTFVGMGALLVALDVADSIRKLRESDAGASTPPPPLDAVWDAVDEDKSDWAEAGAGLSVLGTSLPRSVGSLSADGHSELLARIRATPVGAARYEEIATAMENAAISVGCLPVPSVWSIGALGVMNAFVVSDSVALSVAATQDMLDTFSPDELMAVFSNLLSRVTEGVADAQQGPLLPPSLDERFVRAMRCYAASDRRTVLAMRDSAPLVSALTKTQYYDRSVPGATIDDALLAWTWPGPSPAVMPVDPLELIAVAAKDAFGGDIAIQPPAELLRLHELKKIAAIDGSNPGGVSR